MTSCPLATVRIGASILVIGMVPAVVFCCLWVTCFVSLLLVRMAGRKPHAPVVSEASWAKATMEIQVDEAKAQESEFEQ